MYQEWMDGIPLLVSGCHAHNAAQLARAERYYRENGDDKMADEIHLSYLIEKHLEFNGR